jgi:hypothetical protein
MARSDVRRPIGSTTATAAGDALGHAGEPDRPRDPETAQGQLYLPFFLESCRTGGKARTAMIWEA